MKTLFLTLKRKPFDVMVIGEKKKEYRRASDWIKSRLINKHYDYVKFANGFSKSCLYFIAEYKGYKLSLKDEIIEYSNGLIVHVNKGDYIISLGDIIESGNGDYDEIVVQMAD